MNGHKVENIAAVISYIEAHLNGKMVKVIRRASKAEKLPFLRQRR